jgi:hypothetical protein
MTRAYRWNPADKHGNLPLIRCKPTNVTDDDVRFNSDMAYMRDLLHEIHMQALSVKWAPRFPIEMSDELRHATEELDKIGARIREFNRD